MDTFLVQVWVPADAASSPDTDLRGVVRHVATGVVTPFSGGDQVVRLLRRATRHGLLSQPGSEPGPDRERKNER